MFCLIMVIPKIEFKIAKLDYEQNIFNEFCFKKSGFWDWSSRIFLFHPKLKDIKGSKNRRDYIKDFYKKKGNYIKKRKEIIEKDWLKIHKQYIYVLEEILEIKWPNNKKITAYISICPICPRFLKTWSFSVFFKYNLDSIRYIIAHEILHFLYFKKWKGVFPKSKVRTFDTPHIEWHLSEILAPVILNHAKIQKIIKYKSKGYKEHRDFRINLPEHFEHLYKESLKRKEPFSKFLKNSYKEIKRYEKDIMKI